MWTDGTRRRAVRTLATARRAPRRDGTGGRSRGQTSVERTDPAKQHSIEEYWISVSCVRACQREWRECRHGAPGRVGWSSFPHDGFVGRPVPPDHACMASGGQAGKSHSYKAISPPPNYVLLVSSFVGWLVSDSFLPSVLTK